MTKNYLTYPCKVMNITQGYTGSYTHSQHNIGSPKDYPWDEACADSGRSAMYCPCDEIKIKKIYGVGNRGTNTIWLESTSKVFFADGTSGYFTMLIIHPNDNDIRDLYVGQKFKRGQIICYEGTDGNATGNHFHFSAGKGKNGTWKANSKGKWVLTCSGGTYKPEKLFYIDPDFTTIKNSKGITFKELPTVTTSTTETAEKEKDNFFPNRGYFKKGDVSPNIGKIAKFMRKNFKSYTSVLALGNTYGYYLQKSITEFQRRTKLEADGYIGPLTLAKLVEYGFEY